MTTRENELNAYFQEALPAFEYCEKVIKKHSKTFYQAFSRLPKQKAFSVYAVYAFCREADDSIDVHKDLKRLEDLEEEFRHFLAGENMERPIWQALRAVFATYSMNITAFHEMIQGQKQDASFVQPKTQEDLEKYCYYVASTVGLMLLPILSTQAEDIQSEAIALGTAMQLTNILRDIGEDFQSQRVYLPKDLLADYGYKTADFQQQCIDARFKKIWEFEAHRAEELYLQALPMLKAIDEDCKEALYLALVLYREILTSVRENNYQCFKQRNFVKKKRQLALYLLVKEQLEEGLCC